MQQHWIPLPHGYKLPRNQKTGLAPDCPALLEAKYLAFHGKSAPFSMFSTKRLHVTQEQPPLDFRSYAPRRRTFGKALASLAVAGVVVSGPVRADTPAPDVAVFCDPTLRFAMRDVGRLFTARVHAPVHVFCAPPRLMLAEIARDTQTDVLITLSSTMDEAARLGLISAGTRIETWRNHLVFAARAGGGGRESQSMDPATIRGLLENGHLAITDPTAAATFDASAVMTRLGLQDALAGQLIGAANTDDVAYLLTTGAAQLGLLHLTDVRANADLSVVVPLPEGSYEPIAYAAGATFHVKSPNAMGFLSFLRTPEATARLRAAGLVPVS